MMDLRSLGFSDHFQERAPCAGAGFVPARVTAVDREACVVRSEIGESFAEITGSLLYRAESPLDLPTVGDWVMVQYFDNGGLAIIHRVLERATVLRRKTAGRKVDFQLIAANLDIAFIMQSLDRNFNLRRLERYLAAVHQGGIRPVVLLSKSDLLEPEHIRQHVDRVRELGDGLPVIPFSGNDGSGVGEIQSMLEAGMTCCLLGSSGVGKTTLTNRLLDEQAFSVNLVRKKDGKGRHTTTRRQLVLLPGGGLLIDTPGMRELGSIGMETGIDRTFPEIADLAGICRFGDCSHAGEPGCAVQEALARGELDEKRFRNFLKLRRESAYHSRSYVEKRRRDKAFGKMVKRVMKIHPKR